VRAGRERGVRVGAPPLVGGPGERAWGVPRWESRPVRGGKKAGPRRAVREGKK